MQVLKYLDLQPTAQQTRASVEHSISALRPPQLHTAAGDELSEAEQLAIVNLPATTLIDLHLVVEDAVGRLGGEDVAAALVNTLNERLFVLKPAPTSEGDQTWAPGAQLSGISALAAVAADGDQEGSSTPDTVAAVPEDAAPGAVTSATKPPATRGGRSATTARRKRSRRK
jgi:hypothetical protein